MHYFIKVVVISMMTVCLSTGSNLFALDLSRYFSNDMVLQRDKPVKVWGIAKKDATVTVSFAGQAKSTKAEESGRWEVTLDPMPASAKAEDLTVKSTLDTRHSILKNVVVGDVFLFARQSSIDVSLATTPEGKKTAEAATADSNIRFTRIRTVPAKTPQADLTEALTKGWKTVDKTSALTMSGAAFHLSRNLAKEVNVPLGIVDLDMGHHFSLAWLSDNGLDKAETLPGKGVGDLQWFRKNMPVAIAKSEGKETKGLRMSPMEKPYCPSVCYNAVIHPLRGISLKGMFLQLGNDYQMVAFTMAEKAGKEMDYKAVKDAWGESYLIMKQGNRMTPHVLPVAPDDLRRSLGDDSLPVAWIMPPGSDIYDYAIHNREVRELQRRTQQTSRNIDLILPGTEHVALSGQPVDEELLGKRCLQWAKGMFYDKKSPASGPVFDRLEYTNGEGTVFFKSGTAEGLMTTGEAVEGFEAAAADGNFLPCTARIEGNTIRLVCDELTQMVFVRYDWSRKPLQSLVNSAGLPAIPFNTIASWTYEWWTSTEPSDLPEECYTPASKWPDRDIALINTKNHLSGGDSQPNPSHLGPTGIWAAPYGPNLYVHKVDPGSPAVDKVLPDDIIYGVNGEEFGTHPDDKYRQFSAAITLAESEAGGGKMILNLRRKAALLEVPIQLEIMGTYSSTTPFNCPKTKRIVEKAEEWMRRGRCPTAGLPRYREGKVYNTNMLFLLASGNPQLQGLVRRYIYDRLNTLKIDKATGIISGGFGAKGWARPYMVLLTGEYYLRTGDPYVLPYMQYLANGISDGQIRPPDGDPYLYVLAKTDEQVGGFRGSTRRPGKTVGIKNSPWGRTDYGLMPSCGMVETMALQLAKESGLEVEPIILERALRHYNYRRAEYAYVLYSYSGLRRDGPAPVDPVAEQKGLLSSMNGKLGLAATLFNLVGGYSDTVEICSRYSVYAFNNTRAGHGGMFFNNFWTPIGAHLSGKKGFQHFMKGQTWWRELYRDFRGTVWQAGRGGGSGNASGVAYVIHYVAPQKRLRILGAPRSAFGPTPPEYLKPALDAHRKRDYALAETLIKKELNERAIPTGELPTVRYFLDAVQTLRASIEYDLGYTETLLQDGKYYYASLELAQLKNVVSPEDPRLLKLIDALESEDGKAKVASSLAQAKAEEQAMNPPRPHPRILRDRKLEEEKRTWKPLINNVGQEDQKNQWRMKVLETSKSAPTGWYKEDFDDSAWGQTTMPMIWRCSHAALFRTTFEVKDKSLFDAARLKADLYKQNGIEIYLNGKLISKIFGGGQPNELPLTEYALEVMRNGTNTLAFVTHHHKRWGKCNFFMTLECHLKKDNQE